MKINLKRQNEAHINFLATFYSWYYWTRSKDVAFILMVSWELLQLLARRLMPVVITYPC